MDACLSDALYTPPETAKILKTSTSTLAKWRMEPGRGPEFVRLSPRMIRYRSSALEEFVRRAAGIGETPSKGR